MSFEGFTVSELLDWSGGRLANAEALGDKAKTLRAQRMNALEDSRAGDLAFFFSKKYQDDARKAQPTVLVTAEPFVKPIELSGHPVWKNGAVISCADPYLAMALLSERFGVQSSTVVHSAAHSKGSARQGVHASAVINPTASVSKTARIDAHCVVEAGAKIGDRAVLYPGCFVGAGASVGEGTVLFPRVTLYEKTQVGKQVRIHAGAVIGADGFGYAPKTENGQLVDHQKIYHLGRVVIGDFVEIGANTCIDRGTLNDTVIGPRCKIDDQVMIGHNCQLGEGVIVCGSVGLAGSVEVSDFVYIGGLSGIPNGVKIGKGAKLGGGSFVTGNIEAGETVGGHPHRKFRDFLRLQILLNRMLEKGSSKKDE